MFILIYFDYNEDMLSPASNSANNINQQQPLATSIYHTTMAYTKWISSWTSSLLPKAQGPKLALFLACRGVVKDDIRTSHYLLPYLLLHVLLNGADEDREGIRGEIMAVLNDCVSPAKSSHGGANAESVHLSTQKVFIPSSTLLFLSLYIPFSRLLCLRIKALVLDPFL